MIEGLLLIEEALQLSIENLVLIATNVAGLLFLTTGVQRGALILFFINILIFLWFYTAEWFWFNSLVVALMWLVIMSVTLLISTNRTNGGLA